jgi:hypothetical protein
VNIVDLDKNPPPNPVADDRNDGFERAALPERPQRTSAAWGVWRPWWYSYWVWHSSRDGGGYWCDHGWWEFDFDRYGANLTGSMQIKPDDHNPTAGAGSMKSGYGINESVTANVSSSQSASVTPAQSAVSYFPAFRYETFWRLLDADIGGGHSGFGFKQNPYSAYRNRTHFTPIWMPDGTYTVNTHIIDCWTPDGMLSVNLSGSVNIRGTLWDDWHIAPLSPR